MHSSVHEASVVFAAVYYIPSQTTAPLSPSAVHVRSVYIYIYTSMCARPTRERFIELCSLAATFVPLVRRPLVDTARRPLLRLGPRRVCRQNARAKGEKGAVVPGSVLTRPGGCTVKNR